MSHSCIRPSKVVHRTPGVSAAVSMVFFMVLNPNVSTINTINIHEHKISTSSTDSVTDGFSRSRWADASSSNPRTWPRCPKQLRSRSPKFGKKRENENIDILHHLAPSCYLLPATSVPWVFSTLITTQSTRERGQTAADTTVQQGFRTVQHCSSSFPAGNVSTLQPLSF